MFVLRTYKSAIRIAMIGAEIERVNSTYSGKYKDIGQGFRRRVIPTDDKQRIVSSRLDFRLELPSGGVILIFTPRYSPYDSFGVVMEDVFEFLLT